MAAVTICSDFGAQKNKFQLDFITFTKNILDNISYEVMGPDAMIFIF